MDCTYEHDTDTDHVLFAGPDRILECYKTRQLNCVEVEFGDFDPDEASIIDRIELYFVKKEGVDPDAFDFVSAKMIITDSIEDQCTFVLSALPISDLNNVPIGDRCRCFRGFTLWNITSKYHQ